VTINLNASLIHASISQDGKTAFMYAAENGQLEVVKYLMENGADKEAKDIVSAQQLFNTADKIKKAIYQD
jgi:ankyrin repeat protein